MVSFVQIGSYSRLHHYNLISQKRGDLVIWFLIAAVAVIALSVLITAKRPLWGTFASTLCAATTGLKLGTLYTLGRWPTALEALALVALALVSYIVLRRKRKAQEEAHPLSRALKEIEAHRKELASRIQKLQNGE